MAGPLSSEEIEDVVSSVRRLVSNEQLPRTLSRDLNAERLLLTPALRVVPETSPLAPLVLQAPLMDAAPDLRSPDEAAVVADVQPQPEPPAGLTPAEADPSANSPAIETGAETVVSGVDPSAVARPEGNPDPTDATEAGWENEIWVDPGPVTLGEAALAAEDAEVLTVPEDGAKDAADSAAASWEQASSDWVGDEPIPFIPLRRRAEHLAARLAAGDVGDAPRASVAGEAAAPMLPGRDDPVAKATVSGTSAASVASELLDEDGTPLSVLDETALQEIVRQTLRHELQGELGERITRNVRKLVRAEINRALMARDLD
ncbi:MAG: hypothetical protein V4753_06230 [Pseudomonadota bacterium]